jgi:hypothetical protein
MRFVAMNFDRSHYFILRVIIHPIITLPSAVQKVAEGKWLEQKESIRKRTRSNRRPVLESSQLL